MKRPILILFALFSLFSATAQRHYYVGVPFHVGYLEDSTRFVIDCLPWHPNGRLFYSGEYEHGRRVGIWKFYDSTGVLIRTEECDIH